MVQIQMWKSLQSIFNLFTFSEKLRGVYGWSSKGAYVSLGMTSLTHWMYFFSVLPMALMPLIYEEDPGALNSYPVNLYYVVAYDGPILLLYIFLPLVYYWKHPQVLKTIVRCLNETIKEMFHYS